jgi:hypothetical protein
LLLAAGILGIALAAAVEAAPVGPGGPVVYTTFQGQSLERFPWFGKDVVVLTADGGLEPTVMKALGRASIVPTSSIGS